MYLISNKLIIFGILFKSNQHSKQKEYKKGLCNQNTKKGVESQADNAWSTVGGQGSGDKGRGG